MSHDSIPIVALNDDLTMYLEHGQVSSRALDVINQIGQSLEKWGFVSITNHGIDHTLLTQAYQSAREVFSLAESQKRVYEDVNGGRQRGYTPLLMERAKGQSAGDLKEFWHIGRELEKTHLYRTSGWMRDNIFPREVPSFQNIMLKFYEKMDRLAYLMLEVIERYLDLPLKALTQLASEGNSVLRVLHYPDLKGIEREPGSVRAAAHEDINVLTLLPAATQPGLQLLSREGIWIDMCPPEGSIILDTGDMMRAITGGKMPATTHRVINPEGESDGGRLSMPFFMHPRPDALLETLIEGHETQGLEGVGMTAQAFLNRRLSENGLVVSPQV